MVTVGQVVTHKGEDHCQGRMRLMEDKLQNETGDMSVTIDGPLMVNKSKVCEEEREGELDSMTIGDQHHNTLLMCQ